MTRRDALGDAGVDGSVGLHRDHLAAEGAPEDDHRHEAGEQRGGRGEPGAEGVGTSWRRRRAVKPPPGGTTEHGHRDQNGERREWDVEVVVDEPEDAQGATGQAGSRCQPEPRRPAWREQHREQEPGKESHEEEGGDRPGRVRHTHAAIVESPMRRPIRARWQPCHGG